MSASHTPPLNPVECEDYSRSFPLVTARIIRINMACIIRMAPGSW